MRIIKAFLFGAVSLFIIITLLSLLIPSNIKVSRTVLINNTTAPAISSQVAYMSNWRNWHPLFKSDSAKIYINPGTKGVKSFVVEYNDKKVTIDFTGTDSSTATHIIKFNMSSPGENEIRNEIIIIPVPNQNNVQVEWQALNKLRWYPWEKFYGIFIDKLTGPGYETALNGLKTFIETGAGK
ncbi:MAG: hypothetical protein QM791_23310 [Ferruginibacter sp.]